MEWIINNWYVILGLLILAVVIVYGILGFAHMDKETQIEKVKEWLKYAVSIAEKDLGSGTGQLKLRKVYDMFLVKFPWIAQAITFKEFSDYVDEALIWLEFQLQNNKKVKELVNESK